MSAQDILTSAWPPLSALIVVPAVGALGCLAPFFSSRFDPKARLCRVWAIAVSLVTLVILAAIAQAATAMPGAVLGLEEARQWIPSLSVGILVTLSFGLLCIGVGWYLDDGDDRCCLPGGESRSCDRSAVFDRWSYHRSSGLS